MSLWQHVPRDERFAIADPASAIETLHSAGLTPDQLAETVGTSTAEMTAQLMGRKPLSDHTMDALRGLLAPHRAEEVAALAGASRAAYLEDVQVGRM